MRQAIHRFTELAQKQASVLWAGVRVTLEAMRHDSAKAWPTRKLLNYLESAEELAREALMVVAEKLHVTPVPIRIRNVPDKAPKATGVGAPLFRLGIAERSPAVSSGELIDASSNEEWRSLNDSPERNPYESHHTDKRSSQHIETTPSTYENRIAALEDVLGDPGRHAARMARALYRQANDITGTRLNLKNDDEVMLDQVHALADALIAGNAKAFDNLRRDIPFLNSS